MPEVLRFNTNIPVQLTLANECGKHVEGRYGEQVMYSLADGRVIYVPLYVEQRLAELAVSSGEPLEICKAEVQNGNRRWIEWHVKRLGSSPPSNGTGVNGKTTTIEAFPTSAGPTNGSGANGTNGASRCAVNGSPPSPGNVLPMRMNGAGVPAMEAAMNAAVNIARRVESGAASEQYFLKFSAADIRSMGVSIFIQMSREEAKWQL